MGFVKLNDGTLVHTSQLPILGQKGVFNDTKKKGLVKVSKEEIDAMRPTAYKYLLP